MAGQAAGRADRGRAAHARRGGGDHRQDGGATGLMVRMGRARGRRPDRDSGLPPPAGIPRAGLVDSSNPTREHRSMFGSLRVRNYRLFASGQVISNVGTWMQRIAQDWLVLELSGKNPVALGIAASLQFLPTLFLTLWAGVLADRVDKRKLLILVQSGMATCALV